MSRPTVNGQVGQSGTRIGVPAACGYNFCHYCQRSGCTTSVYTVTMIISRVSTGDFRCRGVRESERPASSARSAFKVAVSIENADHADKADGFELRRLSSRGSGQKIILGGGLPPTMASFRVFRTLRYIPKPSAGRASPPALRCGKPQERSSGKVRKGGKQPRIHESYFKT